MNYIFNKINEVNKTGSIKTRKVNNDIDKVFKNNYKINLFPYLTNIVKVNQRVAN